MRMSDSSKPRAGWYNDGSGGAYERWWDGTTWTENTRLLEPEAGGAANDSKASPSYLRRHRLALALGLLGLIVLALAGGVGAFLLTKGPDKETQYLNELRAAGLGGDFANDAAAVAAGRQFCRTLDEGGEVQGVRREKIAVLSFCPKYSDGFAVLEPIDVEGSFTIIDTSIYSSGIESAGGTCSGAGGYGDINSITQVIVKSPSGEELARTQLGSGSGNSISCVFRFSFTVLDGESQYIVAVGDRGESTYSAAELKTPGTVALSLGS